MKEQVKTMVTTFRYPAIFNVKPKIQRGQVTLDFHPLHSVFQGAAPTLVFYQNCSLN